MLGWIAAVAYLAVSALCLGAAGAARRIAPKRTILIWTVLAALFVLLAMNRLLGWEDAVRAGLRAWLNAEGEYAIRRSIQGPIAAALLLGGGLGALAVLLRQGRRAHSRAARATAWASRAGVAMIGLVALRLVSLHATDALLYAPLRLNWVIDIGCTVVVGICAAALIREAARWSRGHMTAPGGPR